MRKNGAEQAAIRLHTSLFNYIIHLNQCFVERNNNYNEDDDDDDDNKLETIANIYRVTFTRNMKIKNCL